MQAEDAIIAFAEHLQKADVQTASRLLQLVKEGYLERLRKGLTVFLEGVTLQVPIPKLVALTVLQQVQHVVGPVSLTEHVSPGLHLYVFGDQHLYDVTCPPKVKEILLIQKFLVHLICGQEETVDLFVEHSHKEPTIPPWGFTRLEDYSNGYLHDIIATFKPHRKTFPNARVHYADIRNMPDAVSLHMLQIVIDAFLKDEVGFTELLKVIADHRRLFDAIGRAEHLEGNRSFQQLLKSAKVTKQLGQIDDVKTRSVIEAYFVKTLTSWRVTPQALDAALAKAQKGSKELLSEVRDRLTCFNAALMDYYLVGRLFRTFKDASSGTEIRVRKGVTYTGDLHSENYRAVFKLLGLQQVNKRLSEKEDVSFQCLKVEGLAPYFALH